MARTPHKTDFTVDVDGVGRFVFGKRRMADEIKVHVEYSRLTEAVEPTPWLDSVSTWMSTIKVLVVRAPDGFDLDELDPLDEASYAKLFKVYAALVEKEGSFRSRPGEAVQAGGEGSGAVA